MGRKALSFREWLKVNPRRQIIVELIKSQNQTDIAKLLGLKRQAISLHVARWSRELGLGRTGYRAFKKRKARRGRRAFVRKISKAGPGVIREYCPRYFMDIYLACHQRGLKFGLVTRERNIRAYLNGHGCSCKDLINTTMVSINQELCDVHFATVPIKLSGKNTYWNFCIRQNHLFKPLFKYYLCLPAVNDIFLIPTRVIARKYPGQRTVKVFVPTNDLVGRPGGRPGKVKSQSFWLKFRGFPENF